MGAKEWLRCPVCNGKTRTQVAQDTVLKNFPLFCPKCKQETVVDVQQLNTVIIKEPDALARSHERRRADNS
jgi:ribosomal protein L44E